MVLLRTCRAWIEWLSLRSFTITAMTDIAFDTLVPEAYDDVNKKP